MIMYVKAPKEFVDYLASVYGYDHRYDTSNDRQVFADGSYLLWDRDFLPVCASSDIADRLPTLGCVALTAPQVRAEQDGVYVNELPDITDERLLVFLGRDPEPTEDNPVADPDSETGNDSGNKTEPTEEEEGGDAV